MKRVKVRNYLGPLLLFGLGFAIFGSRDGRIPRLGFYIGDDKFLIGMIMMLGALVWTYAVSRD